VRVRIRRGPLHHVSDLVTTCIQEENFSESAFGIFMLFGDLDGFNWSNKDRGALIMVLNTVTYKLIGEVPLEA
jgi:hypothetical protein